jgi:serine/threonine-protein kinase
VLVGGRFRVDRLIATGGMGEVWAAEQCATGMPVALKTLRADVCSNLEVVQRFKREALLLGRVRSDRVARVIDFLVDAKCGAVLVTEFVEGHSLADAPDPEPLPVERALELGIEIALALQDLHRARIVHRDLKPGNVILQPLEDGRSRAVIVDLGVSRVLSPDDEQNTDALTDITRTNIVLGTIGFMAPEQILGPREVTPTADVYSLGAILFRIVGGQNVFGGMSRIEQLRAKLQGEAPRLETGRTDALARGFEAVVSRALEREPTLRYASAEEMAAALSALRGKVSGAPTGVRSRPRGGYAVLAAIAAIAVSACAMAGFAYRTRTTPPLPPRQADTVAALRASPDFATEPPGVGGMCLPTAAFGLTPPSSNEPPAASARRAVEAAPRRDQRARDADLIRAIQRAVAEESYMTLIVPSQDELPAASAYPSTASRPVFAAAGR